MKIQNLDKKKVIEAENMSNRQNMTNKLKNPRHLIKPYSLPLPASFLLLFNVIESENLYTFFFASFCQLMPRFALQIEGFFPLLFALIKLCFDCHFSLEYVIKADLGEFVGI
jgi:hypothetical protein